tara:strand:+ start:402 stop:1121 length:720 start_codon:yes stop_codon:yes gene_type:complete
MNIVISQPMFFPWVGLFEQIKLSNCYVHYDDAQYSKGSFTNRVQMWDGKKTSWMSVPVIHTNIHVAINEVEIDYKKNWQHKHLQRLKQSYVKSPFKTDMMDVIESVYAANHNSIADLSIASIEAVCRYFNIGDPSHFIRSSQLGITGKSSARVINIVKKLNGTDYITGHGARQYLDHELFESEGIAVDYMDYKMKPYPQLGSDFTPYVSILDLIANCGTKGKENLCSGTKNWKEFLNEY